jgi:glycosyltransferase involved in cell wall biosynthesis
MSEPNAVSGRDMTAQDSGTTVAIGMPVFNGERWLRQSVNALLAQTRRDFTLVISDNASTDRTEAICREFAAADPRINYHRNETNIGVFRNYNRAFELTRSTYFKWASANDLCAPEFLDQCITALEAMPSAVLVYPSTMLFTDDPAKGEHYAFDLDVRDSDPVVRFRRVVSEMRLNNALNGVYRADALRRTSLNGIYMGSDIVMVAELALVGLLVKLPSFLFFRRMTADAASAIRDARARREFFAGAGRNVEGSPTWDVQRHLVRAVNASSLTPRERLRAWFYLARRFWWRKTDIWREYTAGLHRAA